MLTNLLNRTIARPLFSYAVSRMAYLSRFLTALNVYLRQLTYLLVANKWILVDRGEGGDIGKLWLFPPPLTKNENAETHAAVCLRRRYPCFWGYLHLSKKRV